MDILYIACVVLLLPAVVTAVPEVKPNIITTEINDYYGYMKDFKGFVCQATGTNLKYSWRHNDIIIDGDYFLKFQKLNASTLQPVLNDIDRSYEGFYQCFVENSIGTIFGRKAAVKFTIIGDFDEYKYGSSRAVDVVVGRPFQLHCPKHALSQNVEYNWLYQDADILMTLPPDENYFIANDGTLYFSVMRDKDIKFINDNDGIFCRQLAQPKVAASHTKLSSRLILRKTMTEAVKDKKADILTNIPSITIPYYGSQQLLKCAATGYPFPKLKWYKIDTYNSAETAITGGTDYILRRFNQYLIIKNITADKAGKYKCVATNKVGSAEAFGRVRVSDYPQWMLGGEIEDRYEPLGIRLEWPCGAFGGPTYNWFRNGVRIPRCSPNGNVVIQNKNSRSYLIIKNITLEYNGMYQCTAGNELDIIYSMARLQITDTHECQNTSVCHQNATCNIYPRSYTCTCNPGLSGDGKDSCVDVNECQNTSICHQNATCDNIPGSYTCTCNPGFSGDGKHSCIDINECQNASVCHQNATCDNIPGSYTCSCNPGLSGDGKDSCVDIDECQNTSICHQNATCENIPGSYTCSCNPGLSGVGNDSCIDIDECQNKSICHQNATCENNPGSYTCTCNPGLSGDGKDSCVAVASSPPNQSTSNDIGVIVGIVVAVVVVAAVVIFIVCILWKRKQAETKNCENAGDDIVLSPPTDSSH